MTIHIDHAVTEIVPQPEPEPSGEAQDTRWDEQEKIRSALTRWQRLHGRIHAEGLDD